MEKIDVFAYLFMTYNGPDCSRLPELGYLRYDRSKHGSAGYDLLKR